MSIEEIKDTCRANPTDKAASALLLSIDALQTIEAKLLLMPDSSHDEVHNACIVAQDALEAIKSTYTPPPTP